MPENQAGPSSPSEVDQLPSKDELAKMDFEGIFQLRNKYKSQEAQNVLGPYEHRAFARDVVKENPLQAVGMAVATPAYSAGKATGVIKARSEGSVEEVKQGLIGVGEGLAEGVVVPWKRVWNKAVNSVQETLDGITKPVNRPTSGLKPWEMVWSQPTPSRPPKAPTEAPDRFEQVFSKLVNAESGGVHEVGGKLLTSGAGAGGITQLMRKTAANPGFGVAPVKNESKEEYLRFGKDYLRAMLKEFNGDYEKALAAYNAGHLNVKKAVEKGADNWKAHLPKPQETLPYIKKILGEKKIAEKR